jgi:hypothetical protein
VAGSGSFRALRRAEIAAAHLLLAAGLSSGSSTQSRVIPRFANAFTIAENDLYTLVIVSFGEIRSAKVIDGDEERRRLTFPHGST